MTVRMTSMLGTCARIVATLSFALGHVAFSQDISPNLPPDAEQMTTVIVKKSMKQLIKDGYQIVTFSAGLGGYGYLLRRQNDWVICSLGLYGNPPALKTFSKCETLAP